MTELSRLAAAKHLHRSMSRRWTPWAWQELSDAEKEYWLDEADRISRQPVTPTDAYVIVGESESGASSETD